MNYLDIVKSALSAVGHGRSEKVAHYTRIGTLQHFIPDFILSGSNGWKSARATPVQFLNDRRELTLGLEVFRDVARKRSLKIFEQISVDALDFVGSYETDVFSMSFSGDHDELGQWRGYASNGMGCSVVTQVDALTSVADVAGWVFYEETRQNEFASKILDQFNSIYLRGSTPKQYVEREIQRALMTAASFVKHKGFKPEDEFRIITFPQQQKDIVFRESGDRLVPFVDFLKMKNESLPIHQIIIGPGWQLSSMDETVVARHHVVQGISRLLELRNLQNVKIESSKIPYDPR